MKLVIGSNEEISKLIALEFIKQINNKKDSVLGFATGTSPILVYKNLIDSYNKKEVSFKECISFNLDEYIGLDEEDINSYRYFMNNNLFNRIDINIFNTHVLKGTNDYIDYMSKYDKLIESYGGIDLQILGLGSDGHIAFNEPGTPFDSLTHITKLKESTIIDNSRLFNDIKDVPTEAVTMGLKSIMNSKKIVLIATGFNKSKAVYDLFNAPINEDYPSTILRNHKDCTIYLDKDAASLLNIKE